VRQHAECGGIRASGRQRCGRGRRLTQQHGLCQSVGKRAGGAARGPPLVRQFDRDHREPRGQHGDADRAWSITIDKRNSKEMTEESRVHDAARG
jgi:hypothetical protein